jgi:hypothetical protein
VARGGRGPKNRSVTKESMRERLLAKLIELGPSYANSV